MQSEFLYQKKLRTQFLKQVSCAGLKIDDNEYYQFEGLVVQTKNKMKRQTNKKKFKKKSSFKRRSKIEYLRER